MKKELEYFYVENSYGFNQDTFPNPIMRMGGCAAVTACDCFIYFKKYFGLNKLYPYDTGKISRKDYIAFSNIIKPYLHPRMTGINKTQMYIDGVNSYLDKIGETRLALSSVDGKSDYETAEREITDRINKNIPVPYLLLNHKNRIYKDFNWHWFVISGCEQTADSFYVKAVSYGQTWKFDFKDLWNTGYAQKGGFVKFEIL